MIALPTPWKLPHAANFVHKRDPDLIQRVIDHKRRTQYVAGEGFRAVAR